MAALTKPGKQPIIPNYGSHLKIGLWVLSGNIYAVLWQFLVREPGLTSTRSGSPETCQAYDGQRVWQEMPWNEGELVDKNF